MHAWQARSPPSPCGEQTAEKKSKVKPARGAKKHACMHAKHTRLSDRLCKRGRGEGREGEERAEDWRMGRSGDRCVHDASSTPSSSPLGEGGRGAEKPIASARRRNARRLFADFPVGFVFAHRFPTERRDFGGILLRPVSLAGGGGGGGAACRMRGVRARASFCAVLSFFVYSKSL